MGKKRIKASELLVSLGHARDLSHASALIMSGSVVASLGEKDWRVDKPGDLLPAGTLLRLKDSSQYVSRGGDKLASAISALGLKEQFHGKSVIDVGSSTGGFTDCVLKLGALSVTALEVGYNQLDWRLRNDSRVKSVEGMDVSDFVKASHPRFDWVLADLSFIPLGKVLDSLIQLVEPNGRMLLLVKPQFELPVCEVPVGGIVADEDSRRRAIASVRDAMAQKGLTVLGEADSALPGRAGNLETFVLAKVCSSTSYGL